QRFVELPLPAGDLGVGSCREAAKTMLDRHCPRTLETWPFKRPGSPSTAWQRNELQKKATEDDEKCKPRDAHEGDFSPQILWRIAEEEDEGTPKDIEAQPDELEQFGRSVRH